MPLNYSLSNQRAKPIYYNPTNQLFEVHEGSKHCMVWDRETRVIAHGTTVQAAWAAAFLLGKEC